jgi:hypothetical protein
MRGLPISTLVAAWALCAAHDARAQDPAQIAIAACQTPALRELRGPRPEADSVRFEPGARVSQRSNAETAVTGKGVFLDSATTVWKSFSFNCTYNHRSGDTYAVTTTVGDVVDEPTPAEPANGGDHAAASACQGAVYKEVRTRNADVTKVDFDSAAYRPLTGQQTSVSGTGRFQTNSSARKSFTYECVFNRQSGQTSAVRVAER